MRSPLRECGDFTLCYQKWQAKNLVPSLPSASAFACGRWPVHAERLFLCNAGGRSQTVTKSCFAQLFEDAQEGRQGLVKLGNSIQIKGVTSEPTVLEVM